MSGLVLMENAARSVADLLERLGLKRCISIGGCKRHNVCYANEQRNKQ
jgi:NAD(P)H-hydrate repair Nnr-like enzyme with NAD(P)H-hydrate epimerase domain